MDSQRERILVIKGKISEMSSGEQQKVFVTAERLRAVLEEEDYTALAALALVAAEKVYWWGNS